MVLFKVFEDIWASCMNRVLCKVSASREKSQENLCFFGSSEAPPNLGGCQSRARREQHSRGVCFFWHFRGAAGEMLKCNLADLLFAEKCCIFALQYRGLPAKTGLPRFLFAPICRKTGPKRGQLPAGQFFLSAW